MTPVTRDSVAPLVNVPPPCIDEACSSWLSRFAASQGADLATALAYLGIEPQGDIDASMVGSALQSVRCICALPQDAFAWHERVMSHLPYIGRLKEGLLVADRLKRPLALFCRRCLGEMRTPYFPIHWRFAVWQWCPIHDQPMEIACLHCGKRPNTLIDIEKTRAGKRGVAYFNRCLSCGNSLISPLDQSAGSRRLADLRPEQQRQIANGRALLSALYHGSFRVHGQPLRLPVSAMDEVATPEDFPGSLSPANRNAPPSAARNLAAAAHLGLD